MSEGEAREPKRACRDPSDEVVQLREWATETVHLLSRTPSTRWTAIGRHRGCSIRLRDRHRRVSRFHAELSYHHDQGQWLLRDLNSTNGTWLHGARTPAFWLALGDEIQIGYATLIAESRRSIELRAYVRRLLGWDASRLDDVDAALRWIRASMAGREALVLCGEDDLMPIARSLHCRTLGGDRPFIVCDPEGCQINDPGRPPNYGDGVPALVAAHGGTLCVRHERLPYDFALIESALQLPTTQVQLIVCSRMAGDCARYQSLPITIPPLSDRMHELDRIIDEYVLDAIQQLKLEGAALSPEDHEWVRRHASSSLAGIEKATLRLTAIRTCKDLGAAAARLGMRVESLMLWVERRKVPMGVACSCCV